MANTLTDLIPVIYQAMDEVSREMVGCIPAAGLDASTEGVAVGQTITTPITPEASSENITPGENPANSGDQTISNVQMTISKSKAVPIRWNGGEQVKLGTQYDGILAGQFAQAFRTLTNEIEVDLCTEAYQNGSRAYGTAGTTPFASSLADAAQIKKILDDNGAPKMGRSLIINSSAGVNLRTLANLNTVYAAGTDATLRQGTLLPLFGFDVKESDGIVSHTKGTGTGYDIVGAGEAVGQTTLSLEGGDSGTILPGDIVTFAGGTADTNKYVVTSGGTASGAATGTIVIGNPGLKIVKVTADEMTIGNSFTANFGFTRRALQLLTRLPEMPRGGDGASDVMVVTDPLTGISFQVAMYRQYRQVKIEVGIAWGVQAIKSEHIAVLLG